MLRTNTSNNSYLWFVDYANDRGVIGKDNPNKDGKISKRMEKDIPLVL